MAKKQGLDIAKLAERLKELDKPRGGDSNGGINFHDVKDGRNQFRILPPRGDAEFAEEVWVHYGVGKGENNSKGTMVVCPKTADEAAYCPVCELSSHYKKLSKKKDDSYDKQARSVYRKKRVYFNAIDRGDDLDKYDRVEEDGKVKWKNSETDREESPVKVLGTGVEIYKSIIGFIIDPEYGDITDPDQGLDVIITKSGSGQFNTNYDTKTARKESPVGFDKWEECLIDLTLLSKPKTVEEIEAIMEGKSGPILKEKDESEEDDDKPVDISDTSADDAEDDTEAEIRAAIERRKASRGR